MIRDFKINIIFCYEFSNVGESSYPFLANGEFQWAFQIQIQSPITALPINSKNSGGVSSNLFFSALEKGSEQLSRFRFQERVEV